MPALQPSAFILRPYLGSGCGSPSPPDNARRRLCVSDFFRSTDSGEYDVLGVQLVTVGERASDVAQELFGQTSTRSTCSCTASASKSAEAGRAASGCGRSWASAPRTPRKSASCSSRATGAATTASAAPPGPGGAGQDRGTAQAPVHRRHPERELHARPGQERTRIVVHHPQAKYFDVRADG